ncbi:spidroin-2-like [Dasypus novemcinctus]|uniref:spidroin-2-like n=1 Tax=Dasypus novemcinctus TaxID=9361 RepID=UPI0039C8F876
MAKELKGLKKMQSKQKEECEDLNRKGRHAAPPAPGQRIRGGQTSPRLLPRHPRGVPAASPAPCRKAALPAGAGRGFPSTAPTGAQDAHAHEWSLASGHGHGAGASQERSRPRKHRTRAGRHEARPGPRRSPAVLQVSATPGSATRNCSRATSDDSQKPLGQHARSTTAPRPAEGRRHTGGVEAAPARKAEPRGGSRVTPRLGRPEGPEPRAQGTSGRGKAAAPPEPAVSAASRQEDADPEAKCTRGRGSRRRGGLSRVTCPRAGWRRSRGRVPAHGCGLGVKQPGLTQRHDETAGPRALPRATRVLVGESTSDTETSPRLRESPPPRQKTRPDERERRGAAPPNPRTPAGPAGPATQEQGVVPRAQRPSPRSRDGAAPAARSPAQFQGRGVGGRGPRARNGASAPGAPQAARRWGQGSGPGVAGDGLGAWGWRVTGSGPGGGRVTGSGPGGGGGRAALEEGGAGWGPLALRVAPCPSGCAAGAEDGARGAEAAALGARARLPQAAGSAEGWGPGGDRTLAGAAPRRPEGARSAPGSEHGAGGGEEDGAGVGTRRAPR